MTTERIAAAAIRDRTGVIHQVAPPGRHSDVCRLIGAAGLDSKDMRDQGFVTDTGRFVSRQEAAVIARNAEQLIRKTNPTDLLFSEDVW